MYIQENLVTSNIPIFDSEGVQISWEVDPAIETELMRLMPFVILQFDGDGPSRRLVGVKDDTEAREKHEAEKEKDEEETIDDVTRAVRGYRKRLLSAFDAYKSNLFYGIETETPAEHQEIVEWYQEILDLPEKVEDASAEVVWPTIPAKIERYLGSNSTIG